jgi:cytochrome c553
MKTLILAVCTLATMAHAATIPEIWKSKCKSCHGETGKADTKTGKKEKVADMTTPDWKSHWTDEKMRAVILDGSKDNKKMKPFKDKLTAEEVDGLIAHIKAFQ